MKATFTTKEIAKLKREARDRKRISDKPLGIELDATAQRHNYANWSLLMKATKSERMEPDDPSRMSLTSDSLRPIVLTYLRKLDGYSIRTLCWSGSLWINRIDVINNTVAVDSFCALGRRWDGAVREYAGRIGVILLTDLEGIADQFVDEVEEDDDDGNQRVLAPWQAVYSTEAGRQALLKVFAAGLDGDFDRLMFDLDQPEYVSS